MTSDVGSDIASVRSNGLVSPKKRTPVKLAGEMPGNMPKLSEGDAEGVRSIVTPSGLGASTINEGMPFSLTVVPQLWNGFFGLGGPESGDIKVWTIEYGKFGVPTKAGCARRSR